MAADWMDLSESHLKVLVNDASDFSGLRLNGGLLLHMLLYSSSRVNEMKYEGNGDQ